MPQLLEEMQDMVPKEFDFLREARLMQVRAAGAGAASLKSLTIRQSLLARAWHKLPSY